MLALLGCSGGPPKHAVKGKVHDAGKPLPVKVTESKSGQWLRVWLRDAQPTATTDNHEATIDFESGAFTLAGGDGRGIPAGKYKVYVEWKDPFPMGPDLLKGKFSEAKSKIVRDIPPPDGVLDIDVSKPEG